MTAATAYSVRLIREKRTTEFTHPGHEFETRETIRHYVVEEDDACPHEETRVSPTRLEAMRLLMARLDEDHIPDHARVHFNGDAYDVVVTWEVRA